MPCGASACASDWLMLFSPALLAPYAGCSGSPRNAPREETLTIRPASDRRRNGSAQNVTFAVPRRLTSIVRRQAACHCSYVTSPTGCGWMEAALLTSTSIPPSPVAASATNPATASGSCEVALHDHV